MPRASAVFVAIAQAGVGPDGNGPKWSDYSHYDLGQAAAHLTVQGASLGLSFHQFAGFDRDAEREERDRVRRPLDEIAFTDKWGTPWA